VELSKEGRKYLRWRRWKRGIRPYIIIGGLALAYWQREPLSLPSDIGFYALAGIMLLCFHHLECRIAAMQFRLAWMHDRLDALAGREPEHHVETELGAEW
jgi:hypothetical protein